MTQIENRMKDAIKIEMKIVSLFIFRFIKV